MINLVKKQIKKYNDWKLKPIIVENNFLEITTNNYTLSLFLLIVFAILVILSIL